MAEYMLLLHEDPTTFLRDLSPEEMQGVIEKYRAWGESLREQGRLVGSNKLRDGEGRVLRPGTNGARVTDGPYSETKEVIGGYFAVSAESYDEAVAIAEGCPHLEYGGTIEVREIEVH